ncbi:MAG: MGMT family protein [Pyrinomonadaceae bacterium]
MKFCRGVTPWAPLASQPGADTEFRPYNYIMDPLYRDRVYKIVKLIPRGRVMTYGQLAEILGEGYTPRTVGFCMHSSSDGVPWHRVINAQGACSTGKVVLPHDIQQRMLEAEGVEFNDSGRCDLSRFLWIPDEEKLQKKLTKITLFKTGRRDKGKPR